MECVNLHLSDRPLTQACHVLHLGKVFFLKPWSFHAHDTQDFVLGRIAVRVAIVWTAVARPGAMELMRQILIYSITLCELLGACLRVS